MSDLSLGDAAAPVVWCAYYTHKAQSSKSGGARFKLRASAGRVPHDARALMEHYHAHMPPVVFEETLCLTQAAAPRYQLRVVFLDSRAVWTRHARPGAADLPDCDTLTSMVALLTRQPRDAERPRALDAAHAAHHVEAVFGWWHHCFPDAARDERQRRLCETCRDRDFLEPPQRAPSPPPPPLGVRLRRLLPVSLTALFVTRLILY